jgi:hypothetical protein
LNPPSFGGTILGVRWAVSLVALAACYSPSPQPGAPCPDGVCPTPLVCSPLTMRCEQTLATLDGDIVDAEPDAQLRDGCTPGPELCDDGIDQDCDGDDPACPANDDATGAIDITGGGMFTADLRYAHDDVAANGCSGDGGRDIFYSVTLTAPRVYYFDTFGSSFDTVVRVYGKPCAMVGTGAGAKACGNDSCSSDETQLAVSLPAGQSCIVIDQASDAETSGNVMLRAIAGTRDGMPLPSGMQMLTGNTSGSTNIWDPVDVNCDSPGTGGKDLAYFFTLCPAQTLLLDAETCTGATWDTVLYVRNGSTNQIGCNDDACGDLQSRITNVPIQNGVFFWLVIDGFDSSHSGAYTLKTNLR